MFILCGAQSDPWGYRFRNCTNNSSDDGDDDGDSGGGAGGGELTLIKHLLCANTWVEDFSKE